MPNANYRAGRRFEYETMRRWETKGYLCLRTAGSHGPWDVIAIRVDRVPEFLQCKVVANKATAKRLIATFKRQPVTTFFHQVLEIKIKGSTDVLSVTI